MKNPHKLIVAAILAAGLSSGAFAQTAVAPAPNEVIYSSSLPSAAEVSRAAAAQGLTVSSIDQTGAQITAVCKNASGQAYVISYQPLPAADAAAVSVAPAPAASVVMPTTPAPQVASVYTSTAPVYYPDYGPYYYDYGPAGYWPGWYPGLSLGFGFGYGGFHGYRGFRGGYGFHGGGFRR